MDSVIAFFVIVARLPPEVSFGNALHIAGTLGRLNAVDLSFDPSARYTLWSGLLGGFFLAMAYFGTDQSQVQRYLSARSERDAGRAVVLSGFVVLVQFAVFLFIGVGVAIWIGRVNFHAPVVPRFSVFPYVLAGSVAVALISAILPIELLRRVQPAIILRGE